MERAIGDAGYFEADDLSEAIISNLSIVDMIRIGRTPAGTGLLERLRNELRSGWTTGGELAKARVLEAILGDEAERTIHNRQRIQAIREGAANDLDGLAKMFEDDEIVDDGTVRSRFESILKATEHLVIPGLQTGIEFSDTGFAGDQSAGGAGFRDPHPSSRNQPGHFLTAVGLQIAPGTVSRRIPVFGSIRQMIGAPPDMSDEDVALRLTIGHEKAPDPRGGPAILADLIFFMIFQRLGPDPPGETDEEREERLARELDAEIRRQVDEVIAAFRTQFQATTDDDIRAWRNALTALGTMEQLDMSAAEPFLRRIVIDPSQRGNSIQDLRLSLVGWRLGELLNAGHFATRAAVGSWIRRNLGP